MHKEILEKISQEVSNDFNTFKSHFLNSIVVENTPTLLKTIATYIVSSGGKKIRPLLTILVSKLFDLNDTKKKKIIHLATAIELIHTATLLHDDVIDESYLRRNNKTANNIWGNKGSILVGDFLFSQSFIEMVNTDNMKILDILSKSSSKIAEAEVWQLDIIGDFDLSFEQYISLITSKTARLFESACECSAIVSDAKEDDIYAVKNFGLNLGVIFQINDDIADYFSNSDSLGKEPGGDFFENKTTLPMILLISTISEEDNKTLTKILSVTNKGKKELSDVMDYFEKYNIKKKAKETLNNFVTQGENHLKPINDSNVKNLLLKLIGCYKE
ncbi:MAG: octaprenyl-diphosphate synthase [Candidatus Midichloriaceae bacterium]|jgi:octaprenyl-diphosphate synthase